MPFSQQHEPTFLWYDYETWGAQPARDRIAQFAGIRTDLNLNPIGESVHRTGPKTWAAKIAAKEVS